MSEDKLDYREVAQKADEGAQEAIDNLKKMKKPLGDLEKGASDAVKQLKEMKGSLEGDMNRIDSSLKYLEKGVEETRRRLALARSKYGIKYLFPILLAFLGIFFLQPNITGNTISDLSIKTTSGIGTVLLAISLILGFSRIKQN